MPTQSYKHHFRREGCQRLDSNLRVTELLGHSTSHLTIFTNMRDCSFFPLCGLPMFTWVALRVCIFVINCLSVLCLCGKQTNWQYHRQSPKGVWGPSLWLMLLMCLFRKRLWSNEPESSTGLDRLYLRSRRSLKHDLSVACCNGIFSTPILKI